MTIIQILPHDFKLKKSYSFGYSAVKLSPKKPVWTPESLLCQPSACTQSDENYTPAAADEMQNSNWEYPTREELLWQYLWIISVYRLTSYSVGDNNTHDLVKQPHIKWDIPATLQNFSPPLLWEIRQG